MLAVALLRFSPPPPNVEPVMATPLPLGKAFGPAYAFWFGFLSIALFDLLTIPGFWTLVARATYGPIGVACWFWPSGKENDRMSYVKFAVPATIAYDLITAVVGMAPFGIPIPIILINQVPFTLLHLVGNVALCWIVSPWIYKAVSGNKQEQVALAPANNCLN